MQMSTVFPLAYKMLQFKYKCVPKLTRWEDSFYADGGKENGYRGGIRMT